MSSENSEMAAVYELAKECGCPRFWQEEDTIAVRIANGTVFTVQPSVDYEPNSSESALSINIKFTTRHLPSQEALVRLSLMGVLMEVVARISGENRS